MRDVAPLVVGATALLAALLLAHAPGMNGPDYWQWPWQQRPLLPAVALALAGALPLLAAQIALQRRLICTATALFLAMVSAAMLQLVLPGLHTEQHGLDRIAQVVAHEQVSSYFSDAARLAGREQLLGSYPQLLDQELRYHSRTKPPGAVLLCRALLRCFGSGQGAGARAAGLRSVALVAGLLLGLLGLLTIPAAFLLFRCLGATRIGAVHGASLLALCTGPVAFFPAFDQLYPVFTCLLLATWVLALRHGCPGAAAACGLVLAVATFFAYHFLVLGAFFLLFTLLELDRPEQTPGLRRVLQQAAVTAVTCLACYALLWLVTGFDPVRTFAAVFSNQEVSKAIFAAHGLRQYPATILPDLIDFALGLSWLPLLLAPLLLLGRWRRGCDHRLRIAWLCLLQIVLVAISGQLAAETARVWIFLMPLALFPFALELDRWHLGERLTLIGCQALLLALNLQSMQFIRL